jgi:hypothetical protein
MELGELRRERAGSKLTVCIRNKLGNIQLLLSKPARQYSSAIGNSSHLFSI